MVMHRGQGHCGTAVTQVQFQESRVVTSADPLPRALRASPSAPTGP